MDLVKRRRSRVNNNTESEDEDCRSTYSSKNDAIEDERFVERHLRISDVTFSILPNGGTGDCLFKAISQAIFDEDESEHYPIRQKIVSYVVDKTWDKYKLAVQIQHVNGHMDLQKSWDQNPTKAYQDYMLAFGNLGSFSELNAAGELFQFNFISIQQYDNPVGITYRVENSIQFPLTRVPLYYFFFTGDFDNGHWEFLKQLTNSDGLSDGTYSGSIDVIIEGQVTSVEFWLMENTQIRQQKYEDVIQSVYLRKNTLHPFDCPQLKFGAGKTVKLMESRFVITKTNYSDLFSVLSNCHLKNESLGKDMQDLLTTYRNNNFSTLNYKLITQPHSHGFTLDALKYTSQSHTGNIQDLLSAADMYGFSFTIYMILGNVLHCCKFAHVDRWGGEISKMENFFLKVSTYKTYSSSTIRAHWYHLVPLAKLSLTPTDKKCRNPGTKSSKDKWRIDIEKLAETRNLENKKCIKDKATHMINRYFDGPRCELSNKGDSSVGLNEIGESDPCQNSGDQRPPLRRKVTEIVAKDENNFLGRSISANDKYEPSFIADNDVQKWRLPHGRSSADVNGNNAKKNSDPTKTVSSTEIMSKSPSDLLLSRSSTYMPDNLTANAGQECLEESSGSTKSLGGRSGDSVNVTRCQLHSVVGRLRIGNSASKISPLATESGSEIGDTIEITQKCSRSVFGKVEGDLVAIRKLRKPIGVRAKSVRYAKSGVTNFSKVCPKESKPIFGFENYKFNGGSSHNSRRINSCTSSSENDDETKEEGPKQNTCANNAPKKLSLVSEQSGNEKPFMGKIVQSRMRRESVHINDDNQSIQTLWSQNNQTTSDSAEYTDKNGCVHRCCSAFKSLWRR